uniref:Uncharacterized protein n=1 Tax=Babesia bovis TaxID=5865 RepID=S6B917_BABBO|nr:hypothetical protein [Babesia bovis]BAN65651.1 hypothetical protein [Babesia bovis]
MNLSIPQAKIIDTCTCAGYIPIYIPTFIQHRVKCQSSYINLYTVGNSINKPYLRKLVITARKFITTKSTNARFMNPFKSR